MEEKEREQIDLEEAKYQQEKRKEAIEKSRMQQYSQTDRVKGLHVCTHSHLLCFILYFISFHVECVIHQNANV